MQILLILNDPPYGTERCYNGLRLALALIKSEPGTRVTVFLMADAVVAAKAGQKTPDGYYNVERMLKGVVAGKGQILLCGTCMDARGLTDAEMMTGARRSSMAARGQVAALLGCAPDEVVFTSGGSEANNLALKGVFFARREQGDHIVTTAVEHPAILAPCRFLERLGARITYLPVDGTGRIDPDDLRTAITSRTILVSIMHANNEVGTIQPIEACASIARERGVLFHTDAAQ